MNQNNFIESLKQLNINVSETKMQQLEKYYHLLIEYNKVMNLTGIVEHDEVYLKHFYDSLTIAKIINLNNESSLCDIGTGAGFPGIVLKIFYPHLKVTLIDSLNKRIKFLNIVIKELKLENIEAIHYRVEEYGTLHREKFDVVTARAVASTNQLLEYAIPIVKKDKYFIAMKGKSEDFTSYQNALKKLDTIEEEKISFKLPVENSDRLLIKFKKKSFTNLKYPRKYNEIKNKSL